MPLLITQLLTALLTAIFTIVSLNRDLRSDNFILKKEAKVLRTIVIFVTITSGFNSLISYVTTENDKKDLTAHLEILKKDNEKLREQMSLNTMQQQNLIVSTTNNLSDYIDSLRSENDDLEDMVHGSDTVPIIGLALRPDTSIACILRNNSKFPVNNLSLRLVNYSNIENCQIGQKNDLLQITSPCFAKNTYEIKSMVSINAHSNYEIFIPNYKPITKSSRGKLQLRILFMDEYSYEQLIYERTSNYPYVRYAVRLVDTKNFLPISTTIYNSNHLKVNWNKEFPLPFKLGLYYF